MRQGFTALLMLMSLLVGVDSSAQKRSPNKPSTSVSNDAEAANREWHFVVSGDSRNCGDLVMPAIAADAAQYHPAFYWHLGDLRAIYEMDEDYAGELTADDKLRPWDLTAYQSAAWDDFIQMQIKPFEDRGIPFLIGIGNHETIKPKTRDEFLTKFAKWLDDPMVREQRMKDAEAGKGTSDGQPSVRTYYHWSKDGIDFIYLDNASDEQFDATEMAWLRQRLEADRTNPAITTIVVGMHKSLPNSLSNFHSMSESPAGQQSGRCTYKYLQKMQHEDHKQVVVLSSHSHFIMTDIYDTPFWREHGSVDGNDSSEVLRGLLVGTGGAVRYRLPKLPSVPAGSAAAECTKNGRAFCAQTDVYGYLLVTVNARGKPGAIELRFKEIKAENVPAETRQKFTADTMNVCFEGNKQMTPAVDATQYLPDGPCPY